MGQLQMTFHFSAATVVVFTLSRAVWYDNSTLGHVDWWLWQNISLASTIKGRFGARIAATFKMRLDSAAVKVWCYIAGRCCDVGEWFSRAICTGAKNDTVVSCRANYKSKVHLTLALCSPFPVGFRWVKTSVHSSVSCQRSAVAWPDVTEWRKSWSPSVWPHPHSNCHPLTRDGRNK